MSNQIVSGYIIKSRHVKININQFHRDLGVWEVPMVMWQDLNGGRCSMGDACSNPSDADGVYKMLMKNFDRHFTSNRYYYNFINYA